MNGINNNTTIEPSNQLSSSTSDKYCISKETLPYIAGASTAAMATATYAIKKRPYIMVSAFIGVGATGYVVAVASAATFVAATGAYASALGIKSVEPDFCPKLTDRVINNAPTAIKTFACTTALGALTCAASLGAIGFSILV